MNKRTNKLNFTRLDEQLKLTSLYELHCPVTLLELCADLSDLQGFNGHDQYQTQKKKPSIYVAQKGSIYLRHLRVMAVC